MSDKTIIFWLGFLLEPTTVQPPNYQLFYGPSTDLEHVWPKFKFLLKLKREGYSGGVGTSFPKMECLHCQDAWSLLGS